MKIQAEAAASHGRVALDRMLIDQLPQIVKEASTGLSGANVNVLNGADGLGEIAAGLVGQGLTILDTVKQNLGTPHGGSKNGRAGLALRRTTVPSGSSTDRAESRTVRTVGRSGRGGPRSAAGLPHGRLPVSVQARRAAGARGPARPS